MADLQMQQNEITVVPPPPPFSPTTSSIGYIDFEESDDEEYTEYGYDDMKYAVNTTCSPTKKEKQKKRSPRKQGSKRSPESQELIRRSDSRFSSRSLKMNFSPNKRKKSGGSVGSTSSHKIEIPDACNNTENKPDKVSRRMSIKQNLPQFLLNELEEAANGIWVSEQKETQKLECHHKSHRPRKGFIR